MGNANAREVQRRVILSRAATCGVQLVLPVPHVARANVYPSAIHRARRRVVNDMGKPATSAGLTALARMLYGARSLARETVSVIVAALLDLSTRTPHDDTRVLPC